MEELDESLSREIRIRFDERHHELEVMKQTYEIVRGYPGKCKLSLDMILEDGTKVHLASRKLKVDINKQLCSRLDDLLGKHGYEMVVDRKQLTAKGEGRRKWNHN